MVPAIGRSEHDSLATGSYYRRSCRLDLKNGLPLGRTVKGGPRKDVAHGAGAVVVPDHKVIRNDNRAARRACGHKLSRNGGWPTGP